MKQSNRYKPRYKICQQVRENIWGDSKIIQKFQSKKWRYLKRQRVQKTAFAHDIIKVTKRPRYLNRTFKNILLAKQKFKKYYGKLCV
jgi:hypothetical protein